MSLSSDGPNPRSRSFLRGRGMGDDWTVRFTADAARAREMGEMYREAGFDVRVLELFGARDDTDTVPEETPEGVGPVPASGGESPACVACLQDVRVVLTRPDRSPNSDGTELPYEG